MSQDAGVPDLLDDTGRLRRLALSFVIAVFVAGIAYWIGDRLATPEEIRPSSQIGAYRFVYYVTGLTFAVVITVAHAVLKRHAAKRLDASSLPPAKLR